MYTATSSQSIVNGFFASTGVLLQDLIPVVILILGVYLGFLLLGIFVRSLRGGIKSVSKH